MIEVSAKVRGYMVCYDLYASYDPEKGYGEHPSRTRTIIRKLYSNPT